MIRAAAARGALLTALLIVGAAGATAAAAPANEAARGQEAYDAGRYAQARKIWMPLAQAADPRAQLGLGYLDDLGKDAPRRPQQAYEWYLRAAEAGLPEAQFNVAAMLDSGRDLARDEAKAALWYAKAAAHGQLRAEYNLAQLYEAGDGVPRNLAQAAVWYRAAADGGLGAAKGRLTEVERKLRASGWPASGGGDVTLVPIQADAPAADAKVDPRRDPPAIELVWAAPAQPVATTFFVQVMAFGPGGQWHEAVARYLDQSALLVQFDPGPTYYAWRVYVVAQRPAHYAAGDWNRLEVGSPD